MGENGGGKDGGGFNGSGRVRIAGCANVTSRLLPPIDRGEGKAIQGCYVNYLFLLENKWE